MKHRCQMKYKKHIVVLGNTNMIKILHSHAQNVFLGNCVTPSISKKVSIHTTVVLQNSKQCIHVCC